jgi:hypothetical protein
MSLTPLCQQCTHKVSLGGYPETFSSTTIACRYQAKNKMILQASGTMKLSQAFVRTDVAVKAGDRLVYNLKDSLVLQVNAITGIGGEIIEYECIL